MDKRVIWGVIIGCVILVVGGVVVMSNSGTATPASNPASASAIKTDLQLTGNEWSKGPATAPVTLVEYADFQCPACGAYYPITKNVLASFPDTVRIIFRNFPLTTVHDKAWYAAKIAEAAGKQGKFWEMHDALYERQNEWGEKSQADLVKLLDTLAKDAGVDAAKLKADIESPEVEARVKADWDSANRLNLNGTPTFFVNNVMVQLPGSLEAFKQIVRDTAASVSPAAMQSSPSAAPSISPKK